MDLDQLASFVAVVEEGGLHAASARLGRSETTISNKIRRLEREVGASLFRGKNGKQTPSEAGRVLFRYAQEVVDGTRDAQYALQDLNGDLVTGEVRVGAMDCICQQFLPHVLQSLQEQHPKIQPSVLCHSSAAAIIDELLSDRLDMALVDHPRFDRRLRFETIVQERISLVCGRPHPFWGKTSVKPAELKGHPFIEICPSSTVGQLVRDYLSRLGIGVDNVMSTDNVETAKKMVEIGYGLAFLPDMVTRLDIPCHGAPTGNLARIEVHPPCTRRVDLVTWRNAKPSRAPAAFLGELRQHGTEWAGCLKAS